MDSLFSNCNFYLHSWWIYYRSFLTCLLISKYQMTKEMNNCLKIANRTVMWILVVICIEGDNSLIGNVWMYKLTFVTWNTHSCKHTYLLSGPLHRCCVCFSELLKGQKTKSKEKRKGRACDPSLFLFSFLLFHFFLFFSWPGKWADRVTPFSCFILPVLSFFIYSPTLLFSFLLLLFHLQCFSVIKPSFCHPTLFPSEQSLTPAWETAVDNRAEGWVCEWKRKIKRGKHEGKSRVIIRDREI